MRLLSLSNDEVGNLSNNNKQCLCNVKNILVKNKETQVTQYSSG